jgi:hypothetical protein
MLNIKSQVESGFIQTFPSNHNMTYYAGLSFIFASFRNSNSLNDIKETIPATLAALDRIFTGRGNICPSRLQFFF